jgi:SAM-dependent methyltransferase
MKLHLGCGTVVVDGWVNVDYAIGARARQLPVVGAILGQCGLFKTMWNPDIVLHDLRKPFPWANGSVDAIYTSNAIEHLRKDHGEKCLQECARMLRPGGILRVVVPNLRGYVQEYVDGRLPARDMLVALNILGATNLSRAREVFALFTGSTHRCMYDEAALSDVVCGCGLTPRICKPRESAIADIACFEPALEDWSQAQLDRNLFVEAVK